MDMMKISGLGVYTLRTHLKTHGGENAKNASKHMMKTYLNHPGHCLSGGTSTVDGVQQGPPATCCFILPKNTQSGGRNRTTHCVISVYFLVFVPLQIQAYDHGNPGQLRIM